MTHKILNVLKEIGGLIWAIFSAFILFFVEHKFLASMFLIGSSLMLLFWLMPAPLIPTVATTEQSFTGNLGMVSYTHTFFGLGAVGTTTLTFQNGSDVAVFKFNRDLSVTIGNSYTVTYQQKETTYFNAPKFNETTNPFDLFGILFHGGYRNTTEVTPENVILASDGVH